MEMKERFNTKEMVDFYHDIDNLSMILDKIKENSPNCDKLKFEIIVQWSEYDDESIYINVLIENIFYTKNAYRNEYEKSYFDSVEVAYNPKERKFTVINNCNDYMSMTAHYFKVYSLLKKFLP